MSLSVMVKIVLSDCVNYQKGEVIWMQSKQYECGLDAAIDVIDGKWKVLILYALSEQSQRFGELKALIAGVSDKVLTQQLREMEADEIVRREIYDEVPPRVEYSLTLLGVSLNEALEPLGAWGAERLERLNHRPAGAGDGGVGHAATDESIALDDCEAKSA